MTDRPDTELRLPPGLSYEAEALWWDEHRALLKQFDESEWEVHEPGPGGTKVRLPYMRLPQQLVDGMYQLAVATGVSVPQLIQSWLEERLEAERKATGKKRAKPNH